MPSTIAVRGMLTADALRLARDRFLIGMAVYLLAVCGVMRWVLPWIADALMARLGFDLIPYYPLLASHFAVQLAPLLPGIVGGFLLLESREDGTIKALLVTPVSLPTYIGVVSLVLLASAIALVAGTAAIIAVGLPPWPALLGAAVAGAPAAPAMALFIAAVADNKVEAFAYLKFASALPLLPTGSYFLAEPGQWLAAVYPPYWAVKAYWSAEAGSQHWPLWVLGGLLLSGIWVGLLGSWYVRAARR